MPLFDIIIPTFNNLEELRSCLHCFNKQTIRDFHIWICVDGSTDPTVEFLAGTKDFVFNYSVLEHSDKRNHQRAATRNLALAKLNATYLVFLDSDLIVQDDFLEKHLEVLKQGAAISVGKIRLEAGNIWSAYVQQRGKQRFKNKQLIPFKYFETNNAAMPADVFRDVNGFDENFVVYGGEDTELACRIWKQHRLNTVNNEKAIAFGKMEKSLEAALEQRSEYAKTGLRYTRQKHPDLPEVFNTGLLESPAAGVLFRFLPERVLLSAAQNEHLSKPLRLKLVHLLVFCSMYRGYHQKK